MTESEIIEKIRKREIGINDTSSFVGVVIRALILALNENITLRGKHIHHEFQNTGDDTVWLLNKGYDYSKEPYEVTNEDWVYEELPSCNMVIQGLDTQPDQLSNPYSRGNFQIERDDQLFTLSAEVRRFPLKISVSLRYEVDSFNDMLELFQVIFSELAYVRTYKFVYLGQTLSASYKIPETVEGEHMTEMDGTTTDSKNRTLSLNVEVEAPMPIFNPKTVSGSHMIINDVSKISILGNEVDARNSATWTSDRGS